MLELSARLEHVLAPESEPTAVQALRDYFQLLPGGRYSGAYFERLAGGGDRPEVADKFTADDVVAVSLLAVDIGADAALQLLEARRSRLSALLRDIPTTVALADLQAGDVDESWPVRAAHRELLSIPGIGETSATKLLARKRPHLVPILDSVVTAELSIVKGRYWRPLHAWLTADNRARHHQLEHLREEAGLGSEISVLRVFDVLAWMTGKGHIPR